MSDNSTGIEEKYSQQTIPYVMIDHHIQNVMYESSTAFVHIEFSIILTLTSS
jgi:hypothetical protein